MDNKIIDFCDSFYNEIINPLTESYYKEFTKRIHHIASKHSDTSSEISHKSKKIKLDDYYFLDRIIKYLKINFSNKYFEETDNNKIDNKIIRIYNKNLKVNYNFVKDEWLCCYKQDSKKNFEKNKEANNFLPLVAYLYDYYYNEYYWNVTYDIFTYFKIFNKVDFLQVMFNISSVDVYDNSCKLYKKINSNIIRTNQEKKVYFTEILAKIITNYFNTKNISNYLFVYLCFPLKTFKDSSYHANLIIIEKNIYLDKFYLNTFEPQGESKNFLIANLNKNIIKNFNNNCEHKYLSKIKVQNNSDKWGYCYFYCNFLLFHILYFLDDIKKKDKIIPIHFWSNDIIKYYDNKYNSKDFLKIIGKFAIFLGLYNKGVNHAFGGSGPSKHYRLVLFNLKKNFSKDIKKLLIR